MDFKDQESWLRWDLGFAVWRMAFHFQTEQLKRLVESHELVENWGGLDDAKFALQLVRYPERLKQAIADVESCMEVSSESN